MYGGQRKGGRCRLGYVIGLPPPALNGPCRLLQWSSKFTCKFVGSGLGGEVHELSPGMAHVEDCEILVSHLRNTRVIRGKYRVRHFTSPRRASAPGEWDDWLRLPAPANPAEGLTKIKSDLAPRPSLLMAGSSSPGIPCPTKRRHYSRLSWSDWRSVIFYFRLM